MKYVFEIYLDSFKQTYRDYWTSVEEACEQLPKNQRFLRSLTWFRPEPTSDKDIYLEADWDFNSKIVPVIKPVNGYLEVTLPGYRFKKKKYTDIPEQKVPGQPYVAATRVYEDQGFETYDSVVCRAEVSELKLNDMDPS